MINELINNLTLQATSANIVCNEPPPKRGGGVGSPVRDLFGSALKLLPVEILLNIFCPVAVDFSP